MKTLQKKAAVKRPANVSKPQTKNNAILTHNGSGDEIEPYEFTSILLSGKLLKDGAPVRDHEMTAYHMRNLLEWTTDAIDLNTFEDSRLKDVFSVVSQCSDPKVRVWAVEMMTAIMQLKRFAEASDKELRKMYADLTKMIES